MTVTEWSVKRDAEALAAGNREVRTQGVNFTLRRRAPDQAYGAPPVGNRINQFAYCKYTAVMDGYVNFSKQSRKDTEGKEKAPAQNGNEANPSSKFQLRPGQFPLYDGLSWSVEIAGGWRVASAQLRHRVPCWGYVFHVRSFHAFILQESPPTIVTTTLKSFVPS